MSIPIFNCFKSKQQKPRNKIIVFANQKGGAGKTTNCVLFGNTLIEHQHPFVMIDGDPQRSIVKKHEQDHERFPDLEPLYQIFPSDLDNEQRTLELGQRHA
jgi:chromosome partitioning protein